MKMELWLKLSGEKLNGSLIEEKTKCIFENMKDQKEALDIFKDFYMIENECLFLDVKIIKIIEDKTWLS